MRAAGKLWRIRIRNSGDQSEVTSTQKPPGRVPKRTRSEETEGAEPGLGRGGGAGGSPRSAEAGPARRSLSPAFTRPGPALRGYPSWAHLERLGAPPGARRRARRCLWSPLGIRGLGSRPPWFRRPPRLLATSGARPPKSRPPASESQRASARLGRGLQSLRGSTEVDPSVRGTLERAAPQEGMEGEKCYVLVFKPRQNSL